MNRKLYEPATEFERETSYCPLYLAWQILDEVQDYFRAPLPKDYADKLAQRAGAVFAKDPFWQRRFKARGRGAILISMRHWLAGVLSRENRALFDQLPESYKVGLPLPPGTRPVPKLKRASSRSVRPVSRYVHGCELLVF
jgi:hypothetical protein